MTRMGMLRLAESREIKNNRGVAEKNPVHLVMLGFLCVGRCIILELPCTMIDQITAINCLETE